MRAALFEKRSLEDLKIVEVDEPKINDDEVLIRVVKAGVNPVDYLTVTVLPVNPLPHIPGREFAGIVDRVGKNVKNVVEGDKVAVYTRIFDGTCDMCLDKKEMLCRRGGRIGTDTNGGFAEYVSIKAKNVFKINLDWDIAASLPVSALTSYHALLEARVKVGDYVAVFGASGNTGMFAVQLAKMMGANVIAISRKKWLRDFGADYVFSYEESLSKVKEVTEGEMVDVVINSLGIKFWEQSMNLLKPGGTIVTFGVLTGDNFQLNISSLYNRHISIIGTTGGTIREFYELTKLANKLKVKVWKEFNLEETAEAIKSLFSEERDGRIMIRI